MDENALIMHGIGEFLETAADHLEETGGTSISLGELRHLSAAYLESARTEARRSAPRRIRWFPFGF